MTSGWESAGLGDTGYPAESPAHAMQSWLSEFGRAPADAADAPAAWAELSRDLFAKRRPELAGDVWDDIWTAIPFPGDLLWAVAIKPPETYGALILPRDVRPVQQEGWVLSVGWGICVPNGAGRRSLFRNPLDLIGARVAWAAFTGEDLGVGAYGMPRHDEAGQPIPERNRPSLGQYWSLKVGDLRILSLKEGGTIR